MKIIHSTEEPHSNKKEVLSWEDFVKHDEKFPKEHETLLLRGDTAIKIKTSNPYENVTRVTVEVLNS